MYKIIPVIDTSVPDNHEYKQQTTFNFKICVQIIFKSLEDRNGQYNTYILFNYHMCFKWNVQFTMPLKK